MLKAILFDLDGTLLPLDLDVFVNKYFAALGPFFAHKVEPEKFLQELMVATKVMLNNSGEVTNEKAFMEYFLTALKQNQEEMEPLFADFYQKEFPKLKKYVGYTPLASQIVQEGAKKGYKIILATNPIFPRLATQHRMEWAGIANLPWMLITTYENSRYAKPNPQYYREICQKIQVEPQECLMVGNDVQEDLVGGTLGMKTFLVKDYLIDRGNPSYKPHYQGSLEDLYQFICQLPQLKRE